MSACMQACVDSDFAIRGRPTGEGAMEMVAAVYSVSPENRATAGETVEQLLSATVHSGTDRDGSSAYEVAFRLCAPLFFRSKASAAASEGLQFWSDVGRRIMAACLPCLGRLAANDLQIAYIALEAGDVSLEKVVEWHGLTGLFRAPHSHTFLIWWPPFATRLLMLLSRREPVPDEKLQGDLESLSRIMASTEPPWVDQFDKRMGMGPEFHYFADEIVRSPLEIQNDQAMSPEAAFAVFGILAVLLEGSDERYRQALLGWLGRTTAWPVGAISSALLSRFSSSGSNGPSTSTGLPYDELIARWTGSQVSFVRSTGPAPDDGPPDDQVALPLGDGSCDPQ